MIYIFVNGILCILLKRAKTRRNNNSFLHLLCRRTLHREIGREQDIVHEVEEWPIRGRRRALQGFHFQGYKHIPPTNKNDCGPI